MYDIKYINLAGVTNKIFIKLGISGNYDNSSTEDASELDYVLSTTLGLSWRNIYFKRNKYSSYFKLSVNCAQI